MFLCSAAQKRLNTLFAFYYLVLNRVDIAARYAMHWYFAVWHSGNDIVIGTGSLWFEYQAGEIGHSVINESLPLQRFLGAVFSRS